MAPQAGSQYPIYNTTFTLHRASPFYIGAKTLDNSNLQIHARRFRDILVGDVLRGVRVGLGSEDETLARVGALQTVVWKVFKVESDWAVEDTTGDALDESVSETTHNRGILVEINYEKANYTAILLRGTPEDDVDDSTFLSSHQESKFLRLPLILTRMPLSLKETFIQYICRTFDTRVSALKLEGKDLTEAFEQYTSNSVNEDATMEERQVGIQKIIKEIQISVGFDIPGGSAALKTIDIHIAREDLPRMLARGKKITRDGSPFMAALKRYIKAHLALDLGHEKVKIVKIACGAFVLGEGRLKLTQPSSDEHEDARQYRATRQLIHHTMKAGPDEPALAEEQWGENDGTLLEYQSYTADPSRPWDIKPAIPHIPSRLNQRGGSSSDIPEAMVPLGACTND
ncbi:hypothetical protein DSL72_006019 [Monilinia vaccinii-corymbosi]|uniref:Uncharacterized protein n=1 Tax=Monilinia vaccinii-corymbosi TaxID=61207 RepID=A0A8A3PGL9_9HELO|nr:hypothetical protein DSL72_006019 [Monilinia vaccinii-corymbosi]